MKRHKSLIALSHDHHHGLKLAMLIKKDAPNYNGLPNDLESKIKYTLNAWDTELKLHFKNEEEILFPFVKDRDEELDIVIDELLIDHKEIEYKVNQLRDSNDAKEILNDLGFILEQHIRKEERELFDTIQNLFSDDELSEIVGKIKPVKK